MIKIKIEEISPLMGFEVEHTGIFTHAKKGQLNEFIKAKHSNIKQVREFINMLLDRIEARMSNVPVDENNSNYYVLIKRVEQLAKLSSRLENNFRNHGIEFVYQLVDKTTSDLLSGRNFGGKSLKETRELLAEHNLCLKDDTAYLIEYKKIVEKFSEEDI